MFKIMKDRKVPTFIQSLKLWVSSWRVNLGFAIFQNYSNYSEDSHRVKNKQTESFCTTKASLLSFLVREERLTFREPVLGKKNIMLKILKLVLVNPYTEKECVCSFCKNIPGLGCSL